MQKKEYELPIGDVPVKVEFNDLADQANSSVIVSRGDSKVLVTATMSSFEKDLPYFPLTVDYEEKFYAVGQILGSRFMRREGRPSEEAVLTARIIDRTIRPLFDHSFRREVQIVATVLSMGEYDPDMLGVIGASLALGTSDIPWGGPVSAVRIGKKKEVDEFELSPTYEYRNQADTEMDLVACGTEELINMIEVGANEASEENVQKALKKAQEELVGLQKFQRDIITELGKKKAAFEKKEVPQELKDLFEKEIRPTLKEGVFGKGLPAQAGKDGIIEIEEVWKAMVEENLPDMALDAPRLIEEEIDALVHKEALENEARVDGRALDEIRPLYAQAGGVSPMLHGSGIFYRGGTHVFSALTLGGPSDSQLIDEMETQQGQKRFIHHYNFPPFSVGETGRIGGFNRRMIGHGALAEKALRAVIPSKEEFPYTIRLVSEAFASNGSTSMASVCGSTLALMDGGVPIKRPVAGIAMGVIIDQENPDSYKILTDIQGPEDHYGDMDFKVAGTREGVTAIQMDVKVSGIKTSALSEALQRARDARIQILDVIEKEISAPRESLNPNAPQIEVITIKPDQIGTVIGPGGKMINGIKDATMTEIDIEEDGSVFITGKGDGPEKAKKMIADLTHEHKAGERYEGEVTRVEDFGAFVRITPFAEGLVHISEMAPFRIDEVKKYLSVGDKVPVIIKEIDDKHRINLSIKQADPEFIKQK
jgi:polyribonucleotide nucleotidyltransferase